MSKMIKTFLAAIILGVTAIVVYKSGEVFGAYMFLVLFAGAFMNFAVMLANGGKMPGIVKDRKGLLINHKTHKLARGKVRLAFFADRFDLRYGIFSVGDFVIFFGIVMLIGKYLTVYLVSIYNLAVK